MSWGLNEQKGSNSVDSGVGEKAAGVCNAWAWGTATFAAAASIVQAPSSALLKPNLKFKLRHVLNFEKKNHMENIVKHCI